MSFLQANLRTRVNYFSVIDQNNQINCFLHFHPCFTVEFSHSAVMISYQNIVPVSAWISRGVVKFKSQSPSCFHFNAKSILCLKYRHKMSRKLNWIIKKIILYIWFAGLTSKTPWTWKLQSDFHAMILSNFLRNVSYCYCWYRQRQRRRLSIMTSKRSKWNISLSKSLWKFNKAQYYLLSP